MIRHGELWGNTEHVAVWGQLGELLTADYGGLHIKRMLVDSGFNSTSAYRFCGKCRGLAFPSKGRDTLEKPVRSSRIEVSRKGQVLRGGLQMWLIDTDFMKTFVHQRIRWPQGEPGASWICSFSI